MHRAEVEAILGPPWKWNDTRLHVTDPSIPAEQAISEPGTLALWQGSGLYVEVRYGAEGAVTWKRSWRSGGTQSPGWLPWRRSPLPTGTTMRGGTARE
jgi:hypothetical protein